MKTTTTTRIECHCTICTASAKRLGVPTLAAEITADGAARLAGRSGKLSKQSIHGVVHAANHPQLGRALRKHRSAYWAA